mgnify:CR=1 FL=1
MTQSQLSIQNQDNEELYIPLFGYELLREHLLPGILGKDAPAILYWAGKDIARKFPLESLDDVKAFFTKAGWGQLEVKEEKKSKLEFELESPIIAKNLKNNKDATFQLEAGFLAQQIERQKKCIAEAYESPKKRKGKVTIIVQWDKHDPLDDQNE